MNRRLVIISATSLVIGALLAVTLISTGQNNAPRTWTTGQAAIGGPFTLTDQNGKPFTDKDLLGKFSLVFFGFTYCPDVCPVAQQNVSAALEMLGDDAKKIMPVFVTTDPERDTVEKVAEYVGQFHKSYVGLTGTPEQVKAAQKVYRIYSSKKKNANMPDGYTVDHASIIYLMDRKGKYVTHFNHSTPPKAMAARIKLIFEQIAKSS